MNISTVIWLYPVKFKNSSISNNFLKTKSTSVSTRGDERTSITDEVK